MLYLAIQRPHITITCDFGPFGCKTRLRGREPEDGWETIGVDTGTLRRQVELDNPLDLIEQIVTAHEWLYERASDDEMTVSTTGSWCDYHLHFSWNDRPAALQIVCAFDCRVPKPRIPEVHGLLALINAQIWLGHFDIVEDQGLLLFRYVLLAAEHGAVTPAQCESLLEVAIQECERFFPAFQFVMWGGKTSRDALAAAMIETVGEA